LGNFFRTIPIFAGRVDSQKRRRLLQPAGSSLLFYRGKIDQDARGIDDSMCLSELIVLLINHG
jgi:hypothetical protein